MKATILAICMVMFATVAGAVDVTQIVFTITSSAATGTPNLRITPMALPLLKDYSKVPIQSVVWRAGKTVNYYLTKSQTVSIGTNMGLWIQADQDTSMAVNSETATMKIYSGLDQFLIFE